MKHWLDLDQMIKDFLCIASSYIARIFSKVVVVFFIARVLGLNDFGVFSFYYAIAVFLNILLEFGYNLQIVKSIAKRETVAEQVKVIQNDFHFKHLVVLTTFLLSLLSCLVLIYSHYLLPIHAALFLFLLVFFIFNSYGNFFLYVYQGMSRFSQASVCTAVGSTIFFFIAIISIYFFPSLLGVGVGLALAGCGSFIFQLLIFQEKYPEIKLISFLERTQKSMVGFYDKIG